MFKRRKGGTDDTGAEPVSDETVTEAVSDPAPAPASASGEGPFDISAAPDDEITRVDLGGLQIPIVENMQLHLEGHNEEANTFALAIVVLEEQGAALQLMAVAAPRSGGLWAEVMDELEAEIQQAGGTMTRGEGRFGPELSGQVPAQDPDGNQGMQVARFVGAEGNRWFVRGMFMGLAATSPAMGEFFEDILAGCIVNRGERPMAPGDLIPLTPPEGLESEEDDDEDEGTYEDLEPFERGPEITETR
ncbi:MAG: DUF3710 domain-containing protein [Actinobacteria bacterium]|nr:DUF3710 domain-containing protein [Actinomycetota bacterium]MCO5298831.1 DUF3710 domain-containing protein [Candidatus Nanopelagicales bacterium]MCB9428741.1 DUF3710 domain-containing protein [Actinomycetota bacterium]HPE12767.1 DUF3710 domain-containing protein [Actinomycetota bacterium]HPQ83525.1 DUF3710 domain-containing protein [Actinomycetota bacterium]